jgi:hypothetical protein
MAGVKITDLGSLGSATSDDLLYIVDVNDFTESPQGTSKKIEVQNIASAIGLESGTYSPTPSGETNGIIVGVNSATYMRIGNVVNCAIQISIQMDTGEDTGSFDLSLPVPSNFTSEKELIGSLQWAYTGFYDQIQGLTISSNPTSDTCNIALLTKDVTALMEYCNLTFQYEVLS